MILEKRQLEVLIGTITNNNLPIAVDTTSTGWLSDEELQGKEYVLLIVELPFERYDVYIVSTSSYKKQRDSSK